ncbi:MAG TPA: ABC transporter ATP-binding protein [Terriglobales bacterium]|nr:ABC transporter ATP-binding protein [Terriglobales bacterium]
MDKNSELVSLLRPHARALMVGFAAVVGGAVFNLLEPWPLKVVLDDVLKSKPASGQMDRLLRHFAGSSRMSMLEAAVAAVIVIALGEAICTYVQKYTTTSVGQHLTHTLRRNLYAHMQRLSLSFHDRKRTGDLISRITDDIDAVQSFITGDLLTGAVNAMTLIGMVAVMLYLNWRFTLIALSVAPLLFAIVFVYTRKIKQVTRTMRKKQGEIVSVLQEVLNSIRVVKAFARENYEVRRLEKESLEGVEIAMKARGMKAKLNPVVQLVVALGTALVLWFGAVLVLNDGLTAGGLIVFLAYLGKMYKPMQQLSQMSDDYGKAMVGYERIREVFAIHADVVDLPKARQAPRLKGAIAFEKVNFCYEEGRPVLRDVDLKIGTGSLAALVGPSGAGKTTIISLVARFYDPTTGVVKIDGVDVRSYRQSSLRSQMAFVLQDTILFQGPIWQNIAYGRPDASRRDIEKAAEMANATEFIDKMPDRFDTIVGERGVTLSGGQRQRIAIARAVIRNSPLLILDEPTTGLDAESERLAFEALDRLMQGKTTIVVAHRLATVERADVIFVIEDGTVAEQGTHDSLLRQDGAYARLSQTQAMLFAS